MWKKERRSMSYEVKITKVSTGETRTRSYPYEWSDSQRWWWEEGNFACDCNREWEFQRAGDEEKTDSPVCGDGKYSIELP